MKWGKTEQTYSSFWLLFGWEELCEEAALSPRFPGDCLGDSCSDIEITSSVSHCKTGCAPVQGSCCLCPQAELSPFVSLQKSQAGFGHQAWITPESRCSCALLSRQEMFNTHFASSELQNWLGTKTLINGGDTSLLLLCLWIRSCSVSFPICGFLTRPCWCRWCWLQDPSSGSGQGRLEGSGAYLQVPSTVWGMS